MKPALKFSLRKISKTGYHPFATCYINQRAINVLIDTGASESIIDTPWIKKSMPVNIILSGFQQSHSLLGATDRSLHTEIDRFFLGDILIKGREFSLSDLSYINKVYTAIGKPKIAGIIGSDILRQYGAIIDYPKRKIIFTESL